MNAQQKQSAARMKARAIREHTGKGFLTLTEVAAELGYKDWRTAKRWLAGKKVPSMPNGRHPVYDVDALASAIVRDEFSGM